MINFNEVSDHLRIKKKMVNYEIVNQNLQEAVNLLEISY